jgi:hypothetical protein
MQSPTSKEIWMHLSIPRGEPSLQSSLGEMVMVCDLPSSANTGLGFLMFTTRSQCPAPGVPGETPCQLPLLQPLTRAPLMAPLWTDSISPAWNVLSILLWPPMLTGIPLFYQKCSYPGHHHIHRSAFLSGIWSVSLLSLLERLALGSVTPYSSWFSS